MKYVALIANYLLAIVYFVFGLNFFFNFIPTPPPEGDGAIFFGVIGVGGFLKFIKMIEVSVGLMMLAGFQKALAYLLIAPISVGILLFEVTIARQPAIGVILVVINAFLIFSEREKYMGIIKN